MNSSQWQDLFDFFLGRKLQLDFLIYGELKSVCSQIRSFRLYDTNFFEASHLTTVHEMKPQTSEEFLTSKSESPDAQINLWIKKISHNFLYIQNTPGIY
jgi:hypothetical protein